MTYSKIPTIQPIKNRKVKHKQNEYPSDYEQRLVDIARNAQAQVDAIVARQVEHDKIQIGIVTDAFNTIYAENEQLYDKIGELKASVTVLSSQVKDLEEELAEAYRTIKSLTKSINNRAKSSKRRSGEEEFNLMKKYNVKP